MATATFATQAEETAAMLRNNLTALRRQTQQALVNIINSVRQVGRADLDAAMGDKAEAFAEDVERVRTLLAGFGVENVPALPE